MVRLVVKMISIGWFAGPLFWETPEPTILELRRSKPPAMTSAPAHPKARHQRAPIQRRPPLRSNAAGCRSWCWWTPRHPWGQGAHPSFPTDPVIYWGCTSCWDKDDHSCKLVVEQPQLIGNNCLFANSVEQPSLVHNSDSVAKKSTSLWLILHSNRRGCFYILL